MLCQGRLRCEAAASIIGCDKTLLTRTVGKVAILGLGAGWVAIVSSKSWRGFVAESGPSLEAGAARPAAASPIKPITPASIDWSYSGKLV